MKIKKARAKRDTRRRAFDKMVERLQRTGQGGKVKAFTRPGSLNIRRR